MTSHIAQTTVTPEKILTALNALSPDRKQQVYDFVEFLMQKQENANADLPTQENANSTQKKILGQHQGMGWIGADFDDPLPNEFWFGDESNQTPPA